MDDAFDLLEDLDEDDIAALEAEFDVNSDLLPAGVRPREEKKNRMFNQKDMISQLDQMIKTKIEDSKPVPRIMPTKQWINKVTDNRENIDDNNNIEVNILNVNKMYESKKSKENYGFTAEEEELFDGLDDDDVIEFAAFSNTHGLLTQEQTHAAEKRERSKSDDIYSYQPVRGPQRRAYSMSDEDADLDSLMILQNLREDADQIFSIRINNVPLELSLLQEIFEALKTTKKIKHLSIAGVGMKDEAGLMFNKAFEENETLETLNLESNDLTNETIEPLCKLMETHPTIREFKCSHQKHGGLGSRGEEAMARALDKNSRILKISYPFNVPSARSLADRCQIRNSEILRQKRSRGEDFYNYREELKKRDNFPQPWIKERLNHDEENAKFRGSLKETRRSFKKTGDIGKMRADAKIRAQENAKPILDNELAAKLQAARKTHGRVTTR